MRELVVTSLAGPALFCNMVNTSYADPPKLHKRWTLWSEIHCGAVLLSPSCRASAAT
jgi:ABC-type enterobactin transport system permease subunit